MGIEDVIEAVEDALRAGDHPEALTERAVLHVDQRPVTPVGEQDRPASPTDAGSGEDGLWNAATGKPLDEDLGQWGRWEWLRQGVDRWRWRGCHLPPERGAVGGTVPPERTRPAAVETMPDPVSRIDREAPLSALP